MPPATPPAAPFSPRAGGSAPSPDRPTITTARAFEIRAINRGFDHEIRTEPPLRRPRIPHPRRRHGRRVPDRRGVRLSLGDLRPPHRAPPRRAGAAAPLRGTLLPGPADRRRPRP